MTCMWPASVLPELSVFAGMRSSQLQQLSHKATYTNACKSLEGVCPAEINTVLVKREVASPGAWED